MNGLVLEWTEVSAQVQASDSTPTRTPNKRRGRRNKGKTPEREAESATKYCPIKGQLSDGTIVTFNTDSSVQFDAPRPTSFVTEVPNKKTMTQLSVDAATFAPATDSFVECTLVQWGGSTASSQPARYGMVKLAAAVSTLPAGTDTVFVHAVNFVGSDAPLSKCSAETATLFTPAVGSTFLVRTSAIKYDATMMSHCGFVEGRNITPSNPTEVNFVSFNVADYAPSKAPSTEEDTEVANTTSCRFVKSISVASSNALTPSEGSPLPMSATA